MVPMFAYLHHENIKAALISILHWLTVDQQIVCKVVACSDISDSSDTNSVVYLSSSSSSNHFSFWLNMKQSVKLTWFTEWISILINNQTNVNKQDKCRHLRKKTWFIFINIYTVYMCLCVYIYTV